MKLISVDNYIPTHNGNYQALVVSTHLRPESARWREVEFLQIREGVNWMIEPWERVLKWKDEEKVDE